MDQLLLSTVCLMLIVVRAESCFLHDDLQVIVPSTLPAGFRIPSGKFSKCEGSSVRFTVTDPHFTVREGGLFVSSAAVYVGPKDRTFTVQAEEEAGPVSSMRVRLIQWRPPQQHQDTGYLKRTKRRWGPPPIHILENDPGPYPKYLDKIVSDSEVKHDVYYTISGPGYNEHPVNLFSFDRDAATLSVHRAVDREEFPKFVFLISVFDKKTGASTDKPLEMEVNVDDENDNIPEFTSPLQFTVLEQYKGLIVGRVNASDRDEVGSLHVKIRYSLLTGSDLFSIHAQTGVITTETNTLDREVLDKHLVTVQIKDMDGGSTGLFRTGTATITLGDINDNPPTFTQPSYAATVKENEVEKLILRIPVEDKDLVNSPNWKAKFIVTKGNEGGNFRVDTDPKTNEGLLYAVKPLDYEKNKNVKLEIMARNEADLTNTDAPWRTVPLDLTVTNVDEGPEFSAPTIRFVVQENTPNGTLIGTYTANDPENAITNIKYFKDVEKANWFSVDKNLGELRVVNTIDRESDLVVDGIYNFTVRAVDSSTKSSTGTVIIVVEDVNDNVPTVPEGEKIICEKDGEHGSVVIVAEDKDQAPLSAPFAFSMPADSDGTWKVQRFNATAATVSHHKDLPNGIYQVPVDITDLQGKGTTQTVPVRICQCRNGACLAKDTSASLGGLGLLALLLPLLLLLLLFLLLAFFCVTKREKLELEDAGDSGGMILKSNTEGRGDEVDVNFMPLPNMIGDEVTKGSVKESLLNAGYQGVKSMSTIGGQSINENWMYKSDIQEYDTSQYDAQFGGQYNGQLGGQLVGSAVNFDNRQLYQDSSFLHNWQTHGLYLHQKLGYLGTEEDDRFANDIIHSYGYEGAGSAAGSVGCCSDFGDGDNLDFLNTLGPKFKGLAEVCKKT